MKKLSYTESLQAINAWNERLQHEGFESENPKSTSITPQIFCPYTKDFKTPVVTNKVLTARDQMIVDYYNQGKSFRYIVKELRAKFPPKEVLSYASVRKIIVELKESTKPKE